MPKATDDLHGWVVEVIEFGQTKEPMTPSALAAKLFEEGGEFSMAVLHEEGWLPHKVLDEPIEGEIADCFMLLLATYGRLFPDVSSEVLLKSIIAAFDKKFAKYKDVITKIRKEEQQANADVSTQER